LTGRNNEQGGCSCKNIVGKFLVGTIRAGQAE
jgi:hypothetical protein